MHATPTGKEEKARQFVFSGETWEFRSPSRVHPSSHTWSCRIHSCQFKKSPKFLSLNLSITHAILSSAIHPGTGREHSPFVFYHPWDNARSFITLQTDPPLTPLFYRFPYWRVMYLHVQPSWLWTFPSLGHATTTSFLPITNQTGRNSASIYSPPVSPAGTAVQSFSVVSSGLTNIWTLSEIIMRPKALKSDF